MDRALPRPVSIPDAASPATSFVISEPLGPPLNIEPSCPADRIMQPFIEEKRRLVEQLRLDTGSPITSTDTSTSHRAIQYSISKVAADLLGTYGQFETIPKKVACMFTISSVLNVGAQPFPRIARG